MKAIAEVNLTATTLMMLPATEQMTTDNNEKASERRIEQTKTILPVQEQNISYLYEPYDKY